MKDLKKETDQLQAVTYGYFYTSEYRQTTSFNDFSIETGILLRGNGVSHAMLDIHMLFARGLPDAVVFRPTQLPPSYTHPCSLRTACLTLKLSLSNNPPLCPLTLKRLFSSHMDGVVLHGSLQVLRFFSGSSRLQRIHNSSCLTPAADRCCVMCR
jgi:hypothetical protein